MPRAKSELASSAPMSEARTISTRPARNATIVMISSGRLPKVALSKPPIADPVRAARCSVLWTMSTASGTIASAAQKKTSGGAAPFAFSAAATGMAINSQWIDYRIDEPWPVLCRQTRRWLWHPAAPESPVQPDQPEQLVALGLRQQQLGVEELAFGVQDFEVAGDAAAVAHVGQPGGVAKRVDEQALLDAELPTFPVLDERVGHLTERLVHGLLVADERFLSLGLGRVYAGPDAAHVEDGQRHLGRDRQQSLGAEPVPVDHHAAAARRTGQQETRKVVGLGHADARGGCRELALGQPDVRPALEQAGGQPLRHLGWRQREHLSRRAAPGHGVRIPPEQHRNQILGLGDAALDVRNSPGRGVQQDLGLADIDERRHTALVSRRHELRSEERRVGNEASAR